MDFQPLFSVRLESEDGYYWVCHSALSVFQEPAKEQTLFS
jgi:hypothetical protein